MNKKWIVIGGLVFLVIIGTGIAYVWNPQENQWEGACVCTQTQGGLPRWSGTCNEAYKKLFLRQCP